MSTCQQFPSRKCNGQHQDVKLCQKDVDINKLDRKDILKHAEEAICTKHNEVYKYFCSDHSLLCCISCVVLHHRQCEDVITTEEAAKRQSEDVITAEEASKRQCEDVITTEEAAKRQCEDVITTEEAAKRQCEDVITAEEASKRQCQDVLTSEETAKGQSEDVVTTEEAAKRQCEDVITAEEASKRQCQDVLTSEETAKGQFEDVITTEKAANRQCEDVSTAEEASKRQCQDVLTSEETAKRQCEGVITTEEAANRQCEDIITTVEAAIRQYKDVITTVEAAKAKRNTNDKRTLKFNLRKMKQSVHEISKSRDDMAKDVTMQMKITRQSVNKYYDDLIDHINKSRAYTLYEIDECEKKYLLKIQKEKADSELIMAAFDNILDLLHRPSKCAIPPSYLYTMKTLLEQKFEMGNFLEKKFQTETISLNFTPDANLSEILQTSDTLGSISVFWTKTSENENTDNEEAMYSAHAESDMMANIELEEVMNSSANELNVISGLVKDINKTTIMDTMKSSLSKDINIDDYITGAAILDDNWMLISKCDNKFLALIDREGTELSSLRLDYYIEGIRMTSPTEGAVVCRDTCLQLFSVTNDGVVKGDTLNVSVKRDFTFHRNLYYIGGDKRIIVYNSSFRHVHDIPVSDTVRSLVVRDDSSLCYTVWRGCELYCITMDGTPVFTYSHDRLQDTTSVTVDHAGYIYVCGYESMNVHQLNNEGKLQMIIFDKIPASPICITFNSRGDKGLIGCNHKVLFFDLKSPIL